MDYEKLLESYDIHEVAQFLASKNVLSESELSYVQSLINKQETISFLAHLFGGNYQRLAHFRREMMRFVLDVSSKALNQISESLPHQSVLTATADGNDSFHLSISADITSAYTPKTNCDLYCPGVPTVS